MATDWHLEKEKIIMGRRITFYETNFSSGKGCSNQNIMGRNTIDDYNDATGETNSSERKRES